MRLLQLLGILNVFVSVLNTMSSLVLVIPLICALSYLPFILFLNLPPTRMLFLILFGNRLWTKNFLCCTKLALLPLPSDKLVVGCQWVYEIKTKADGSIQRYKACLVAKGFTQDNGIDFRRLLLLLPTLIGVAAIRLWNLSQMDVKNAFLNGDLTEEIFMVPPLGLSYNRGEVCNLRKALYGLK